MTFKVGDKVTIVAGYGRDFQRVQTVEEVGGRQLKLDDGTKWTLRGDPWGAGRDPWCNGPSLHSWEPRHDEAIRRRNLLKVIVGTGWSSVPTATLEIVAAALKEAADGNPPA